MLPLPEAATGQGRSVSLLTKSATVLAARIWSWAVQPAPFLDDVDHPFESPELDPEGLVGVFDLGFVKSRKSGIPAWPRMIIAWTRGIR